MGKTDGCRRANQYSFNRKTYNSWIYVINMAQDQPRYYVDMLIISIIINLEFVSLIKNLVKTLE
jgi:hypothetical protein